ncbi:MAG: hypothetical protein QXG12_04380 [Thermoproteota archaeon]
MGDAYTPNVPLITLRYLKDHGPICATIGTVPTLRPRPYDKAQRLYVIVRLDTGVWRGLFLTIDSEGRLSEKFGPRVEDWVGKRVKVSVGCLMKGDVQVEAIQVEPLEG